MNTNPSSISFSLFLFFFWGILAICAAARSTVQLQHPKASCKTNTKGHVLYDLGSKGLNMFYDTNSSLLVITLLQADYATLTAPRQKENVTLEVVASGRGDTQTMFYSTLQLSHNLATYQKSSGCSTVGSAELMILSDDWPVSPALATYSLDIHRMEAHECHSASSAVVVLHAYPSMALKGNSNSKQQAAKLKDAFLGSSKVFNRSHPMVDTHRVLVKLNAPWSDAGASSRIPTRKPRDPMTISNSSYCPADPLSVAVSGGETCKIHVEPSPTSDADVFSTVGGVISAIGNVVFPEFGWLLDVGFGALNGIFSIFGLGNDTTEVNSLDVWNCIQGYVEQYVHQIVDQLHTQEINQRVKGILYSASQLNRTVSQSELTSKFGAVMTQITTTSVELILNYQAPASGIIGQLASFGTTYVAFRSAELNNYAFFYGTPLDSASRKIKYDDTVSTINTYHQLVSKAYNESLTWRSTSDMATEWHQWMCNMFTTCIWTTAHDTVAGWSMSSGDYPNVILTSVAYGFYRSTEGGDAARWLAGQRSNALAAFDIQLQLSSVAQTVHYPMVIPNKRLIIVNETLKKKTYPFGNCGYIETSSNAMKVQACDSDSVDGGLVRGKDLDPTDVVVSLSLWKNDQGLSAAEMTYTSGTSSGVLGITDSAVKSTLTLAAGERIVRLQVWCNGLGGITNSRQTCVSVAQVNVTTSVGRNLLIGARSEPILSPPEFYVDLSNAAGKAWACGLSGRQPSAPGASRQLTAIGFDWCYQMPKLACAPGVDPKSPECDWRSYPPALPPAPPPKPPSPPPSPPPKPCGKDSDCKGPLGACCSPWRKVCSTWSKPCHWTTEGLICDKTCY